MAAAPQPPAGAGGFGRADAVRVIGSVILPIVLITALVSDAAPAWAVLTLFALELAVGGLDNLLSVHGRTSPALPWGARVLGASALVAGSFVLPGAATALAAAAVVVSAIGVGVEFWRARDLYL